MCYLPYLFISEPYCQTALTPCMFAKTLNNNTCFGLVIALSNSIEDVQNGLHYPTG